MKLYLECSMGASGDMLMAALSELLPDKAVFINKMNALGIPGLKLIIEPSEKCGIKGSHARVFIGGEEESVEDFDPSEGGHHHEHEHAHHQGHEHAEHEHERKHSHYGYADISALIEKLNLSEKVKADALAVYRLIAEAEAQVHGVPVEHIHFHELGSLDAVADVVGFCILMEMLSPESISASPVHVGSGFVRCAHGLLPVPAPATALLLKGIPIYGGKIKGELCTPTGAALLRHFVGRFGNMETMAVSKIGYGMGTKDFEAANCVRAFLGESEVGSDKVIEIVCNLDDMTPEAIGAAVELLLEQGALDVFTTPISMKKSRPAVMLSCLCTPDERDKFAKLILTHTTTLGVRYINADRLILERSFYSVNTSYGPIRVKSAEGYGISKEKPEYDDVLSAAKKNAVPFTKVYSEALTAIDKVRHC